MPLAGLFHTTSCCLREVPAGFKIIECYMGRYMCFVDGDGLVYPCGQLIGQFPALNFMEVGFKKAWENLALNKSARPLLRATEFNQLYGLKLNVIGSNAKREMKNIFKKTKRAGGR